MPTGGAYSTEAEAIVQSEGVCNADWQSLQCRVAESTMQSCRVYSAELQSLQDTLAAYVVQRQVLSCTVADSGSIAQSAKLYRSDLKILLFRSADCRFAEWQGA